MKAYNKALDHTLMALAYARQGKVELAASEFKLATTQPDTLRAMAILEANNKQAYAVEAAAKVEAKAKTKAKAAAKPAVKASKKVVAEFEIVDDDSEVDMDDEDDVVEDEEVDASEEEMEDDEFTDTFASTLKRMEKAEKRK